MNGISVITMSSEEMQELISNAVEKGIEAQRMRISSDEGHPEEVYLTRKQVCEKMNISFPTLYSLNKSGVLCPYQLSGRILYKLSEVLEAPIKIRPIIEL